MTCEEALSREGEAPLSPTAVTFQFSPKADEPYTVFWDVTATARYLVITKTPVRWLELAGLESWFEESRIRIDREHAMSERVDPRIPILAVRFEDGSLPVDGWHRIYRCIKLGWTQIPVLFLEGEQEHRFRYPQATCERLRQLADDPGCQMLERVMEKALRRGGAVYLIRA